uniref:C3H1-type domain-containing protein n=1 Tax=Mesocestoides corti TaxID=53468 RepID=A0A5K3F1L9_MESCO
MLHVMARYKTESCRKPPRMCRQGYSCPYYHNGKDKRRMPDRCYYRSTPCPVVRPADEWLDSSLCEAGDSCTYCHTRTEQQFHPEIYKSTKCNDVLSSGYCPRGPFCAFAHSDSEMTLGRNFIQSAATQQQAGLPPSSSSRQQNASPVSSSTSASSSGIFSPAIRPLQCPSRVSPASAAAVPPVGGLYATQTYPSSSLKLRMRHRSGGTEGLGVTASPFDQSESTPPPLSLSQPSVISAFPIFSPAGFGRSGFVGQQTSMLSSSSTTTTATTKSPPFASTTDPIQPRTTAAQQSRKKLPADTSKFSRMRLESAGALLENYARGLAVTTPTTTQQQQQLLQSQLLQSQQRSTGRCLTKVQPRQPAQSPTVASTPTTSAPKTPTSAFQSAPWWFADPPQQSRSVEAEQHNLDNEYLNSLITDELRTQLTINTSTEDLHHHQFFKLNGLQSLTQSPLSCLLRQMQLSTQVAPTNVTTKRGSGLFDDNPMGGVISSPLSSPPGVTLPSGTTTSAAPLTTSSVIDQPLVGCQSAPVCIPTNGNRVCGGGIFDLPCSCGCCRNRGGQDSAFNSGGTPTVVCEFGAVGSTSLQSGTSEGQDSALALSEAKDDEPLSGAFGSGSGGGGSSSTGLG